MIKLFKTNKKTGGDSELGKQVKVDQDAVLKSAKTICQFFGSINEQLLRQNKLLIKDLQARRADKVELKACFNTAAECQKQTADLANHTLRRHALYPAILTVDMLAELIGQMAKDATVLMENHPLNKSTTSLAGSVIDLARIAESKVSQLEMKIVHPKELDEIDSSLHEIAKAVETDQPDKNRKICETIRPGLSYHGETLRMAKIAVYRFVTKKQLKK
jgi:hypothetical protein